MLADYGFVLLFIINGAVFAGLTLLVAWMLRPNRPNPEKLSTYECGEEAVGSAWIQFNNRFYVIALMFLIFEVEVVLLFPWATVFQSMGWYAFWAMLVFVSLIFVGFLYELGKGDLQWDKPQPVVPHYVDGVGVVLFDREGASSVNGNGAPVRSAETANKASAGTPGNSSSSEVHSSGSSQSETPGRVSRPSEKKDKDQTNSAKPGSPEKSGTEDQDQ